MRPGRRVRPSHARDDRLDQLGEQIDEARTHAEDADLIDDPDEPKFYESGSEGREEDDQTIAPPG